MASPVRYISAALIAGGACLAAGQAQASPFSAAELSQDNLLLSQFNLITTGNLTQTATLSGGATAGSTTIQGRAIVGGNATLAYSGSATTPTVCYTNCTGNASIDRNAPAFGAMTVFGNLTTPSGTTASNTLAYAGVGVGDLDVKGTLNGNVVLNRDGNGSTGGLNVSGATSNNYTINATTIKTTQSSFGGASYNYNNGYSAGTTPQVNQTIASVFPFSTSYQTNVNNLSQGIANLPGTPGVSAQALPSSSAAFFTANADYTAANGLTYGVITTTLANLVSSGLTGVSNGNNAATFVIVSGDGANYTLPNLNSYADAGKVIFDFVNATTLKFAGNWNGSILAPLANITQMGGTINGSVVVASITQSQALNDSSLFSGNLSGLPVPEPASLALLGVGVLGAGFLGRRRRA